MLKKRDVCRYCKGRRFKKAGFFYPAFFLLIILITTPCFADFRFAVMGDSRGKDDGINTEVLDTLLEQVESDQPEFIIFVGDLITGSKHNDVHRDRLIKWKEIIEKRGIPVHIAVGNHEITSETSEDIIKSLFKELVHSFDYNNAHLVILDTNVYGDFHRVDKKQMEWLKIDLEQSKKEVIFVFGHEPAYPIAGHIGDSLDKYPHERDEMWQLLAENGVTAYFCGHEHLYNSSIHKGIRQIITGGAGARFHASPEDGGFYHYVIVDVKDNGQCDISVKDIEGEIKDSFQIDNLRNL